MKIDKPLNQQQLLKLAQLLNRYCDLEPTIDSKLKGEMLQTAVNVALELLWPEDIEKMTSDEKYFLFKCGLIKEDQVQRISKAHTDIYGQTQSFKEEAEERQVSIEQKEEKEEVIENNESEQQEEVEEKEQKQVEDEPQQKQEEKQQEENQIEEKEEKKEEIVKQQVKEDKNKTVKEQVFDYLIQLQKENKTFQTKKELVDYLSDKINGSKATIQQSLYKLSKSNGFKLVEGKIEINNN